VRGNIILKGFWNLWDGLRAWNCVKVTEEAGVYSKKLSHAAFVE
jgi:hypothetical protein